MSDNLNLLFPQPQVEFQRRPRLFFFFSLFFWLCTKDCKTICWFDNVLQSTVAENLHYFLEVLNWYKNNVHKLRQMHTMFSRSHICWEYDFCSSHIDMQIYTLPKGNAAVSRGTQTYFYLEKKGKRGGKSHDSIKYCSMINTSQHWDQD